MIDIDFAPAVFGAIILGVFILPALYGATLVDKFWKQHKEAAANKDDDAFN